MEKISPNVIFNKDMKKNEVLVIVFVRVLLIVSRMKLFFFHLYIAHTHNMNIIHVEQE